MHVEVNETLLDNVKVKRLSKKLGVPAVIIRGLLTTLWLQVLRHKEDGCLDGWDEDEIGEYSEWDELIDWLKMVKVNGHIDGLPTTDGFVKRLESGNFIDRDLAGDLWIHDWENYAGTLKRAEVKTKERERKRKWRERQRERQLDLESPPLGPIEKEKAPCPADVPGTSQPVPGTSHGVPPDQNRIEQTRSDMNGSEENNVVDEPPAAVEPPEKGPARETLTAKIDEVVAHYKVYHPRSKPSDKVRKKVGARLKENWTVADIKRAIDGCHKSGFHCGDNKHGRKYQTLDLIVRDSDKVQQFIEIYEDESKSSAGAGRKGKKNVDAVKDFVNRQRKQRDKDPEKEE